MGTDWYDQDNPPFVYVDFQTLGCTTSDAVYFTVFGIPPSSAGIENERTFAINIGSLPDPSGGTLTFHPGEEPCFGFNDESSVDNGRECLVFGMFTDLPLDNSNSKILALVGNLIGNVPLSQGEFFSAQEWIGNGVGPTPDCEPSNQYLFRVGIPSCYLTHFGFSGLFVGDDGITNIRFIEFYNAVTNFGFDFSLSTMPLEDVMNGVDGDELPATLAFPALTYDCDGSCETCPFGGDCDSWELLPTILPYGESSPLDTAPLTANPLADIYEQSYVPLAPLPFEGLNGGNTPSLGQYLASIFKVAIVVTAILSVLMIVFHGIAHATTAVIDKKSDHRQGVWNALLGLLLALGSWLILNTINPELASELSIGIPEVSLDGDAESISTSPVTDGNGTITAFDLPDNMNIFCEGSGGSASVPTIIDSFSSKVTYRWGGKGGALPSGGQFKLSPNEQKNGPYMCSNNGQSVPCRTFCPEESVCLDCSGFVNHVRQCAGLSIYSGTSSMTSSGDAIAIDMDTLSGDGESIVINGTSYTFQPGDILVWSGSNPHVVIYYGDGKIAESKGDIGSIKNPNQNIKKTNLSQSKYKKKITHLIKAVP